MGENSDRSSRLYGVAQTVILCVFAIAYFADRSRALVDPAATALAGAVLSALGLLLMAAAFAAIRGNVQIEPRPRDDARLVTCGVYARLRHPIYTAILLVVVGLVLRKPTPIVAVLALAVIGFLAVKVRVEERFLLARYPDYGSYMRRTWGLVPWFRRE